ncbi:MAG: hypothetical protein GY868_02765 [Deltaproteobacteria bacterium]|nr:hypothetical protein [Deltaproteobacteria bacterium]
MAKKTLWLGVLILALVLPACMSKRYNTRLNPYSFIPLLDLKNQSVGRMKTRFIAEQINENLKQKDVKKKRIAVLPFANLENLNSTTAFGQFMGEQLVFELTQLGFTVVEIRSSHAVYLAQRVGELFLQRTETPTTAGIKRLGMDVLVNKFGYDLDGLFCGTYVYSRDTSWGLSGKKERIYVNGRIVRLPDLQVLSAASAELSIPLALKYSEQLKELEEFEITQKSFSVLE